MVRVDCGRDVDVVAILGIFPSLDDVLSSMSQHEFTLSSYLECDRYWGLSQEVEHKDFKGRITLLVILDDTSVYIFAIKI